MVSKKLFSKYQIPEKINMYDFLIEKIKKNYKNGELLYELFGIILHSGSALASGHYISLIKDRNVWKEFNDSHIEDVDDQKMKKFLDPKSDFSPGEFTPYILFYRQKD
jgi:ubiquitin C-terminal hydrolase